MADEAQVRSQLQIRKIDQGTGLTLIDYPSKSSGVFKVDVDGTKGPVPGAFTIYKTGTNVDFSQLTLPGLCVIKNLSPTWFFTYGIYYALDNRFFPLGEVLPAEEYVLRLSRDLGVDYYNTGTGTDPATATRLQFRLTNLATVSSIDVLVEAFER